jgi:hypothetical protein
VQQLGPKYETKFEKSKKVQDVVESANVDLNSVKTPPESPWSRIDKTDPAKLDQEVDKWLQNAQQEVNASLSEDTKHMGKVSDKLLDRLSHQWEKFLPPEATNEKKLEEELQQINMEQRIKELRKKK